MTEQKTLVLLTSEFPYEGGDSSFLGPEITHLASAFDRVYILSSSSETAGKRISLPPNVAYVGPIAGSQGAQGLLKAALTTGIRKPMSLFVRELLQRRGRIRVGRTARASVLASAGAEQIRLLLETLEKGSFVAIYSYWAANAGYALAALGGVGDVRVTRLHGYDLYEWRTGQLPFRKEIFAAVHHLLPISDYGAAYLRTTYPPAWVGAKIQTLRLGTSDPGTTTPSDGKNVVRIASCSSVDKNKRVEEILRAVLEFSERTDKRVEWVHFGDGPLLSELKRTVSTMSAGNLNASLRGHVPNSEVLEYYTERRIDAFINLSRSEGIPVSMVEALSVGIPVVATAVGGVPEIVSPALRSGELIPASFSTEMAVQALSKVVQAPRSYDPRLVWERTCVASKNTSDLISLLTGGLSGRQ